jgi:hypothetical protein
MDCRSFTNDLEEYLQGGLDFAGRFSMERHAAQCYVCRRSFDEADSLGRMAREIARVAAPADFEAQLLERIHARESGAARALLARARTAWDFRVGEFRWWSAAAAAAPVLALALGVAVWRAAQPSPGERLAAQPPRAAPQHGVGRAALAAGAKDAPSALVEASVGESEVARPKSLPQGRPAGSEPSARSTRMRLASDRRPRLEPADSGYLEYRVPGDRDFILRLPPTIRMRYAEPSEDHFIRNVSH